MRRGLLFLLLIVAVATPLAAARSAGDAPAILLRDAIDEERDALRSLAASPPNWERASAHLEVSRLFLSDTRREVDKAVRRGALGAEEAAGMKDGATRASSLDVDALTAIKRKDADRARVLISRAIEFKQRARLAAIESQQPDDAGAGRECTATKQFELYAIPQGYNGSYADVFPHIPAGAKNIKVSFASAATGRAVPVNPFPGQSWKSEIKGRKPDGRLWVRVTLSGTGIGKPDEKHVTWKVVVGYDIDGACPK